MFGPVSPTVRNLLARQNSWLGDQFLLARAIPVNSAENSQVPSPSMHFVGVAFNTSNGAPERSFARLRNFPEAAAGGTRPRLRLDASVDQGATYSTLWESRTGDSTIPNFPLHTFQGRFQVSMNASNSQPGTLDHIQMINPSGANSHFISSFGGNIRYGLSTSDTGSTIYRSGGSGGGMHEFQVGTSVFSTQLVLQLTQSGSYMSGAALSTSSFETGTGASLSSPTATLSSGGSLAVKGRLITEAIATLSINETVAYCDPSLAISCAGTPSAACSSYTNATNCNAHNAVGCTWFAGDPCSNFNGDESSCTVTSGCTWEQASCSSASNTDESTCTGLGGGGFCSWDASTCGSQGDESSCTAITGCSWSGENCSNFNFTDQSSCEGNSGCSWFDDSGNCSSYIDESSCSGASCVWDSGSSTCGGVCSGQYNTSCSGNICSGDYPTGSCTGTYGAACNGTALCSNITSETPCNAESGCTWSTSQTVYLPLSSEANRSNKSRIYSIVDIATDPGALTILPSGDDVIKGYPSGITLNAHLERVMLHHHNVTRPCSNFDGDEATCNGTSGCSWTNTCNGSSEEECTAVSGCSWSDPNCDGNYVCSGSYTEGKFWIPLLLQN